MFKIDEDTGIITTLKQLDREDSRNLINGAYILEILATERSKLKVWFIVEGIIHKLWNFLYGNLTSCQKLNIVYGWSPTKFLKKF